MAGLKAQLKAENEREQHEAIDRLEEYIGDLDNKHANLQEFLEAAARRNPGIVLQEPLKNRDGQMTNPTRTLMLAFGIALAACGTAEAGVEKTAGARQGSLQRDGGGEG